MGNRIDVAVQLYVHRRIVLLLLMVHSY